MLPISKCKLTRWAMALPLLIAIRPALLSQSCCPDPRFEILKTQLMATEFKQRQMEYRAWQASERRNVPVYNARLNGAVIAFHKHIVKDDHYLATNCGLCRKYLQEIKSYSKKLEQAMK
ncbi:MAG: hypothetical protein L0387_40395 [Acidobacteria bacterium]|nr:hypothetical protein [Acidobacteriota bacterium]MCI0723376.1 hypothetical protein [Acidobacteriota bacterium]